MLHFDRFLGTRPRALDLASGRLVDVERVHVERRHAADLFATRGDRTLIDIEPAKRGRIEIWEDWIPRRAPQRLDDLLACFREVLDGARHGAPRAFDLPRGRPGDYDYARRALAREARLRGWVPIGAELLGMFARDGIDDPWPEWLADRTMVIFAETPGVSAEAALAMLRLARSDVRPHLLVRSLAAGIPRASSALERAPMVHEQAPRFRARGASGDAPPLAAEAAARWAVLVDETQRAPSLDARRVELAGVLARRDQPFEARALLARVRNGDEAIAARRIAVEAELSSRTPAHTGEWEMVDDFVGVLQICQDIEDEQVALSRVGAYLRERLQASAVAFIAREAHGPHVLTRVGTENARVDLAVRSIETGLAIPAHHDAGPVESACPVRHASEVIGAVWCRWSAGMPVAPDKAASLLGVAAVASAPSLRLAIARRQLAAPAANPIPEIVGESAVMAAVRQAILRAAASPFPVVIEGESGSGKELVARAIHARSARSVRRFCAINCAALVDDLVEAELFGHARGAFTGANSDRAGLFEDASGGTLFLDEVAELGVRVQAKLLRVLQEGEVRRLGESMLRGVDVRIVAATNRPLAAEVAASRFRKDLWYRLDVIRVTLPPLRARLEDLPLLATHLWQSLTEKTGSKAVLRADTISALSVYDWPGNVRELHNVLASLVAASPPTGLIPPGSLPAHMARAAACEHAATLGVARRQFEERYVRAALARAGGRIVAAAGELGVTRQGLLKLMARLGIEKAPRHRDDTTAPPAGSSGEFRA